MRSSKLAFYKSSSGGVVPRLGATNSVVPSGSVPGNMKSACLVAVAVQVAGQLVSIGASGKGSVVATPAFGFGQANGGTSSKMSAAHITKPSTGRGVTCGPAKPGWFCGRAG